MSTSNLLSLVVFLVFAILIMYFVATGNLAGLGGTAASSSSSLAGLLCFAMVFCTQWMYALDQRKRQDRPDGPTLIDYVFGYKSR